MTGKEIIVAAVKKADKNGYKEYISFLPSPIDFLKGALDDPEGIQKVIDALIYSHADTIIFSQSFLKAFFGEALVETQEHGWTGLFFKEHANFTFEIPAWEHYGRQLLLEEDRLKYLEKFL